MGILAERSISDANDWIVDDCNRIHDMWMREYGKALHREAGFNGVTLIACIAFIACAHAGRVSAAIPFGLSFIVSLIIASQFGRIARECLLNAREQTGRLAGSRMMLSAINQAMAGDETSNSDEESALPS